jgi:hypothetical protein
MLLAVAALCIFTWLLRVDPALTDPAPVPVFAACVPGAAEGLFAVIEAVVSGTAGLAALAVCPVEPVEFCAVLAVLATGALTVLAGAFLVTAAGALGAVVPAAGALDTAALVT